MDSEALSASEQCVSKDDFDYLVASTNRLADCVKKLADRNHFFQRRLDVYQNTLEEVLIENETLHNHLFEIQRRKHR